MFVTYYLAFREVRGIRVEGDCVPHDDADDPEETIDEALHPLEAICFIEKL